MDAVSLIQTGLRVYNDGPLASKNLRAVVGDSRTSFDELDRNSGQTGSEVRSNPATNDAVVVALSTNSATSQLAEKAQTYSRGEGSRNSVPRKQDSSELSGDNSRAVSAKGLGAYQQQAANETQYAKGFGGLSVKA